jgi:hypothetical protein
VYRHIPGEENVFPDRLSRQNFDGTPDVILPDLAEFDEDNLIAAIEQGSSAIKLHRPLTRGAAKAAAQATPLPQQDPVEYPIDPKYNVPHTKLQMDDVAPVHRAEMIRRVHNHGNGHHGINRTLRMLNMRGVRWPKMAKDITQFIAQCEHCNKNRIKQEDAHFVRGSLGQFAMFEEVSIDFIGPLPTDQLQNQYICCITCGFTRFVEAFAVEGQSAVIAAHCLLSVFARYGLYKRIRSDRGTPFVNEVIAEFARICEITQILTPPYHPQADGIAERNGGEVMRHLRALVRLPELKSIWSVILPLAVRIVNKTYRQFLGCSPADLVYFTPPDLDRGIFEPFRVHEETVPITTSYMRDLQTAQERMLDATSLMLWETQDAARRVSTEPEPTEFLIGSYVCLRYPTRPPSKLHDRLAGPFQITDIKGNLYIMRDLTCNRMVERDVSFLVPFIHPGTAADMLRIAAADIDETTAVSIDSVRGQLVKRSTLEFQVTSSDGDVSWESWDTVRKTAEVSNFLQNTWDTTQDPAYQRLLRAASPVPPSK